MWADDKGGCPGAWVPDEVLRWLRAPTYRFPKAEVDGRTVKTHRYIARKG
jgi:hypothetical protein